MNRIEVYLTFDTAFQTWNVVTSDLKVVFYHSNVLEVEEWLQENAAKYREV